VSDPPPAVEGDTSLTVGPDCATAGVTNSTASRQNMPVEAFIIRYTRLWF